MFELTEAVRAAVLDHAAQEFPRECCGLVTQNKSGALHYVPSENLAAHDHFILDHELLMAIEGDDDVRIMAIVHSHPNGSPKPSMADRLGCARSALPWLIAAWPSGAIKCIEPDDWAAPLVGRTFHHGVLDCYTLLQDYYRRRLGVTLPDFERDDAWWELPEGAPGSDLYATQFEQAGFVQVQGPLQVHDVLMMQVAARCWNHAAIYTGDDRILHHLYGRVSCHDTYDDAWRDRTKAVLRHISRIRPDEAAAQLIAA